MSNVKSESPLVRYELSERALVSARGAGVIAWERALLGHINLRGDARDPNFVARVNDALNVDLPVTPNAVSENDSLTVFWLGPNEWLIVTERENVATIAERLRQALHDQFHAVTEVSGGQTALVLRGPSVRALLAKECPLDLHPRAFHPGQCAQSHLAKAPILLRQLDLEPAFEIIFRRSFADYLWLWLEHAAAEYGLAVMAPATAKPRRAAAAS